MPMFVERSNRLRSREAGRAQTGLGREPGPAQRENPVAGARARSHATRVLHSLLLLAVLHQLIGSNFIERPSPGDPPEWPFLLHEWVGLVAFGVVTLFWLWTLLRHASETPVGGLIPWLSISRLTDIFRDLKALVRELMALQRPTDAHDSLAVAVHGVGLLIVSVMAGTGASWYLFPRGAAVGKYVTFIHMLTANLTWAYVVVHASVACVHHLIGSDIFSRMFWFRRRDARAEG